MRGTLRAVLGNYGKKSSGLVDSFSRAFSSVTSGSTKSDSWVKLYDKSSRINCLSAMSAGLARSSSDKSSFQKLTPLQEEEAKLIQAKLNTFLTPDKLEEYFQVANRQNIEEVQSFLTIMAIESFLADSLDVRKNKKDKEKDEEVLKLFQDFLLYVCFTSGHNGVITVMNNGLCVKQDMHKFDWGFLTYLHRAVKGTTKALEKIQDRIADEIFNELGNNRHLNKRFGSLESIEKNQLTQLVKEAFSPDRGYDSSGLVNYISERLGISKLSEDGRETKGFEEVKATVERVFESKVNDFRSTFTSSDLMLKINESAYEQSRTDAKECLLKCIDQITGLLDQLYSLSIDTLKTSRDPLSSVEVGYISCFSNQIALDLIIQHRLYAIVDSLTEKFEATGGVDTSDLADLLNEKFNLDIDPNEVTKNENFSRELKGLSKAVDECHKQKKSYSR